MSLTASHTVALMFKNKLHDNFVKHWQAHLQDKFAFEMHAPDVKYLWTWYIYFNHKQEAWTRQTCFVCSIILDVTTEYTCCRQGDICFCSKTVQNLHLVILLVTFVERELSGYLFEIKKKNPRDPLRQKQYLTCCLPSRNIF